MNPSGKLPKPNVPSSNKPAEVPQTPTNITSNASSSEKKRKRAQMEAQQTMQRPNGTSSMEITTESTPNLTQRISRASTDTPSPSAKRAKPSLDKTNQLYTPLTEHSSQAVLSSKVPPTPVAANPPVEVHTPISPVRLPGSEQIHRTPDENIVRKLFDQDEHASQQRTLRSQQDPQQNRITRLEISNHMYKLLELLDRDQQEVLEFAERRKQELQEQWQQDLTEMENATQTVQEMVQSIFQLASTRSQGFLNASGISLDEYTAMCMQYQTLLTKVVEATAAKLATV